MSTATFTNASTGVNVDPDTIAFKWEMSRQPGTEQTYTYTF